MNKRGDIPVTILVIGVFLVCTIALVSFFSANAQFKAAFSGLNLMEGLNSDVDRVHTYSNLEYDYKKISDFYLEDDGYDQMSKGIFLSKQTGEITYNGDGTISITKRLFVKPRVLPSFRDDIKVMEVTKTFKP